MYDNFLLQIFKSYRNLLNFFVRTAEAERSEKTGAFQDLVTQSMNPGISNQKFSNRKILAAGMVVSMDTTQGTWSEEVLASVVTTVFG